MAPTIGRRRQPGRPFAVCRTTRGPAGAGEDCAMTEALPPHLLRMGQVLRDSRPKSPMPERIGDYVNLYAATVGPHSTKVVPFEAGINSIALTPGPDGPRRPA